MAEGLRKKLFFVTVFINFIMVTVYEFLTPNMSDDIIYGDKVAEAHSFFDLFAQEYEHYMHHIGRSIAHILLRIFLFIGNKGVFNVVAGLAFCAISLLIYANVRHRKEYDVRVYAGIVILLWLFEPTISNSVLWETGACNYLFTAVIMFTFITVFRKKYSDEAVSNPGLCIGMFFLGLAAGWCNENSSGGVIFMVLVLMAYRWISDKNLFGIRAWQISALVGSIIGFVIMILSPGNSSRADAAEELHTGVLALASRFLKITLNIKDNYLVLVLVFMVMLIAIAYRTGSTWGFWEAASTMCLFGIMFFVTCYALIAVPESQLRTYYCASLFLMTGIAEGFAWICNEGFDEDFVQIIGTSLVAVFLLIFVLTYIQEGANLARIKREFDERDAYLTEMAKGEEMVVEAPMLRPEWQTRYSMAYVSDLSEDKFNWLNLSYSEHYGLWYIIGVDRETWTAY